MIYQKMVDTLRRAPGVSILDADTPVLLLRLNHNILHHGTLGAIRSLGRSGLAVYAILEGGVSPIGQSRYIHERLPWGPSVANQRELLAYLDSIALRIGRPAVLIAMDDASALFVAQNATKLTQSYLFPSQDPSLIDMLADKATLAELCRKHGVAHPPTHLPRSSGEVDAALHSLGLPLIAKWARPWQLPAISGRRTTVLVFTRNQAHRLFAAVRPGTTGPLLLQQRVATTTGSDWFFQGYFDASSNCLFAGTGRKELSAPPRAGQTVLGRWLPSPRIEGLASTLLSDLGYTGIVDLDIRHDQATGISYLLDINPRLGAQFRLFTRYGELDLVRAMHLDLTHQPVPQEPPRFGRTFLVENHYARPSVRRAGEPRRRLLNLRRDLPVDELAWFSTDDPAPFMAMGAYGAAQALRRLGRRRTNPVAISDWPM